MAMPPFNEQFLNNADPNSLPNIVLRIAQQLDATQKRVIQLENIAQAAPLTGTMTVGDGQTVSAGGAQLTANGAALTNGPSDLTVNFWASVGVPSNAITGILAMAFIGNNLYVGGTFSQIGGILAANVACYNIVTGVWSALGTGLSGGTGCYTLAVIGTDLYVGGDFSSAGGVSNTAQIAKWNGAWSALGTGVTAGTGCFALAVVGTSLYAGGGFTTMGGVANTTRFAKWDGSAWSAIGTGLNSGVTAFCVIGTDLYVGGGFTSAGGVSGADRIAKWDTVGGSWSALGSGLNGVCYSMTSIGTDLYVGGQFTSAGGVSAVRIAKWDTIGGSWSALGSGLNGVCSALASVGTMLYAGGNFTDQGNYVVGFDTAQNNWVTMGAGLNNACYALAVSGTDLYVGGGFSTAGGLSSKAIAAYLATLQSTLAWLQTSTQALQDNGGVFPNNLTVLGNIIFGGSLVGNVIPSGSVWPYGGRSAPSGYLICDGSAVSRATYPNLTAAIMPSLGTFTVTIASPGVFTLTGHGLSTADQVYLTTTGALPTGLAANTLYYVVRIDANTFNLATTRANARAGTAINTTGSQSGVHSLTFCPYGLGDGSTTFNVPNLKHSVAGGLDTGDTNFDVLGLSGGEETHLLTSGEMPSHTHTQNAHNHTQDPHGHLHGDAQTNTNITGASNRLRISSGDSAPTTNATATNQPATPTNNNTGGGAAHNNLQPYVAVNYIIKT